MPRTRSAYTALAILIIGLLFMLLELFSLDASWQRFAIGFVLALIGGSNLYGEHEERLENAGETGA